MEMKDPLQREQTPYEVLGVGRSATPAEVFAAFQAGMLKRKHNVQVLMGARKVLESPDERGLLDLQHYDPQALSRLLVGTEGDGVAFQPVRRRATAQVWEAQLAKSFPDAQLVHTLGVFFYWWALYEEERIDALLKAAGKPASLKTKEVSRDSLLTLVRQAEGCAAVNPQECAKAECVWREDCTAPAAPVRSLWERAIACWVSVATELESCRRAQASGRNGEVHKRVAEWLQTTLHNLGQRYRDAGFPELAENYTDLELMLATEQRTARYMANAGIKVNNKPVACGLMLLRMARLLDSVRDQVNAALKRSGQNKDLMALQSALSSYTAIAVLIDNRKPKEALDAIARVSERRRATDEVRQLEMRALSLLGQQSVELGDMTAALDAWEKALALNADKDIVAEIRRVLVSTCQERAAALQKRRRDEAIAMLDRAVRLSDDKNLRLTLAEVLTQRAIDIFNKVQEEAGGLFSRAMADRLKGALADLERAAQLGSTRASGQCEAARNIAKEAGEIAKSGLTDLPKPALEAYVEGNKAAGRKDYDKAADAFRRAIAAAGANVPGVLHARLSNALANRGVGRANRALELHNADAERQRSTLKRLNELMEKMDRLGFGNYGAFMGETCALCPSHLFGAYYTFSTRDGKSVRVCSSCGAKLNQEMNSKPQPSSEVTRLLQDGHEDLLEATELDPSNDHARDNLKQIEKAMSDIGVTAKRRAKPKAPPKPAPVRVPKPAPAPVRVPSRPAARPSAPTARTAPKAKFPLGAVLVIAVIFGVPLLGLLYTRVLSPSHGATLPKGMEQQTIGGISFVPIPSGMFMMGSPEGEKGRGKDETLHMVKITQGFWMGQYEVTQAQWRAVMGNNPSVRKGDGLPVENVTWEECQEFLRKLNAKGESTFRLPTEAEWEYACRAGKSTPYSFGADERQLGNYAWYTANSRGGHQAVGKKRPNAWGLYDMHGNVSEWVQDYYDEYPRMTTERDSKDAKFSMIEDPKGPEEGGAKVVRGGAWRGQAVLLRSGARKTWGATTRHDNTGLRLVRVMSEKSGMRSAPAATGRSEPRAGTERERGRATGR